MPQFFLSFHAVVGRLAKIIMWHFSTGPPGPIRGLVRFDEPLAFGMKPCVICWRWFAAYQVGEFGPQPNLFIGCFWLIYTFLQVSSNKWACQKVKTVRLSRL